MKEIAVTLLGEKDHGKSTLIGNMLIATGSATKERVAEAKRAGGAGFEPAFVLDSFTYERKRGMTLDTTRAQINFKDAIISFIDVPGHLELINNALGGASGAEIAIVMVSAKEGEGFQKQTKRHIFIANMLGMRGIFIAVNKMDALGYRREKFDRIKDEISGYMEEIGFEGHIEFIPVSAYGNENIITKSKKMGWYGGGPLVGRIYDFFSAIGSAQAGEGTRMVVQDTMELGGKDAAMGMLYYGRIRVGDRVRIEPSGREAVIGRIHSNGKETKSTSAVRNIAVEFDGDAGRLERGDILYGKDERPWQKGRFTALIYMTGKPKQGSGLTLRFNNTDFRANRLEITRFSDATSAWKESKAGQRLKVNTAFEGEVTLDKDPPVEKFSKYRELGRFSIYSDNDFCGFGIVR